MKLIKGLLSMLIGYFACMAWLALWLVLYGETIFQHDYYVMFFWVAFYGFGTTIFFFLVPFLISKGRNKFWNPLVCTPIGALLGFAALSLIFPSIGLNHIYGGGAAVMGGISYFTGTKFMNWPREEKQDDGSQQMPGEARETSSRPSG